MMERVFRVDLYPHEFLTLTAHMTPEQRGVFITICCLIYAHRGKIKNDAAWVGRVANCHTKTAKSIISTLHAQGDIQIVDNGGFIEQKRSLKELSNKRQHLVASSRGGRQSAVVRSESNNINGQNEFHYNTTLGTTSPSPLLSTTSLEIIPANGEVGKDEAGRKQFDVVPLLNDRGWEAVREASNGWDKHVLAQAYNTNIREGRMKPPDNANAAFPAWITAYTKGKPPQ